MSNQERIKEYLVGKNGYLKSNLSNGKVIMLSGKWGSGKTHFWQNEIASDILKKELKDKREVYSYVSLYGKSSIEEIENDIFSQAYSFAIGGENFITKGFATFTKRMKRFGSSKIANGLKDEQKDNIERTALSRLNNGGIICFDDFERKSKDIDLNDLFGFITQLTLNFQCKVVIILNDDVFEGEEKNIFSNVKEKTVSKFLYFNPTIEELFTSIYTEHKINDDYNEEREKFLEYIKETTILNARIYSQVLDNLLEWLIKYPHSTTDERRCLILCNINFILYHTSLITEVSHSGHSKNTYEDNKHRINLKDETSSDIKSLLSVALRKEEFEINSNVIYRVELYMRNNMRSDINDSKLNSKIERLKNNPKVANSLYFSIQLNILRNMEDEKFKEINNFIETGILINE